VKQGLLISATFQTAKTLAGAYVSESNFFQKNRQQAFWGANYSRLSAVKKKYDPQGLFLYITALVVKSGERMDL
jgi:Berberine and berberine like